MSDSAKKAGTIGWIDLTVPNADQVRDFYKSVVGWESSDVPMGDYSDYCMHPGKDADPVAGVCWKKGKNESVPSHWMVYINVANLEQSLKAVEAGGGEVVGGPSDAGGMGRYAVIRDPAGAVCALFEPTG